MPHTPPPWEIVYAHGVPIGVGMRLNGKGELVNVFKLIGNTMAKGDTEDDLETILANSLLIAAAPNLLHELISCKAALEWKSVVRALGADDHADLYRRVCKAISDATQEP